MHHEVLLALAGYPGSIFRISKETSAIEVGLLYYHYQNLGEESR